MNTLKTRFPAIVPAAAAAIALAVLSSSAAGGPVVWSAAQGGNNHSYDLVLNDATSWSGARDAAAAAGGYLATETSAAEQQFINGLLTAADAPTGQYWLGLRREGGAFGWDNGEALAFSGWDAGEPNNNHGLEDSGGVLWSQSGEVGFGRRGSWNDSSDVGYASGEDPGHPDLARAGFLVERDAAPAAVPLPQAAFLFAPSAAFAFACWRRANRRQ